MKEGQRPFCHGEPMTAIYRYRSNGELWRTYYCECCHNKKEVKDK